MEGATSVFDLTTGVSDSLRYRPLGLMENPFKGDSESGEYVLDSAVAEEGNKLLNAIGMAASQERSKPIVVTKHEMPSAYPLRAIAGVEHELVNDEEINILHAYIQFFMLHTGRVRSTLHILGERLAFRSFDKTLIAWVEQVLSDRDESLISFDVLGAEALDAFAERFREDPAAAIESIFGPPEIERRPELAEVSDLRLTRLETDVDEDQQNPPELDASVPDAPGTAVVMAEEADAIAEENVDEAILDYIVDYTKARISPVVARALRVYRERGLAAMATEFRVTKAPRKTLAALAKFARVRFRKVVLIYDGFDSWNSAPPELRRDITTSLSEIRWLLDSDAMMVMMLEKDGVDELEEAFSGGTHIDWTFDSVRKVFDRPDVLDLEMVDSWLSAAAVVGSEPITTTNTILVEIAAAANGSMNAFVIKAHAAIESAADRGVGELDDEALAAGLAAGSEEAPE